jgi:alanyl-tRNA synthetase
VKKAAGVFIHIAKVTEGTVIKGQPAKLEVAHGRRSAIRANHSATHLLHEALRRWLGDHVAQRGSLNAADRLRFDFSHSAAISAPDLATIEAEVNDYIRQNTQVETRIMTPDEARAIGAQALFGEKYGDEVRVVSMGVLEGSGKGSDGKTYSLELCGGTHVRRTESASSAGVRRIEALTGQAALDHLRQQDARLNDIAAIIKAPASELADRIRALFDERKALANEVAQLRREVAMGGKAAGPEAKEINGMRFIAQVLSGVSGKDLPALIDEMKARLGSGAVLLIADTGAKPAVAAGVTADLTARLSAVTLVKAAAEAMGGKGGGGRPDLAQAGGADIGQAEAAIKAAEAAMEAL